MVYKSYCTLWMLLNNLSYEYQKGLTVIDSFSYSFSSAGLYVITGVNGSGKTTLLRIMSGLLKNYSGEFDKRDLKIISSLDFLGFDGSLSVIQNLKLFSPNNQIDLGKVDRISKLLRFTYPLNFKFKKLSSGNQFKIRYLLMLLLDADIIIFDEPLNYLDKDSKHGFLKLMIDELGKGKIIIFASHILTELDSLDIQYTKIELS